MIEEWMLRAADALAVLFPFDCMSFPFMRRAMLGLLLLAPLTAGTGIQVVNSRMAFFSDAIGHSAFAGVAIGLLLAWNPNMTMMLLAVAVGVSIMLLKRRRRLSTDTVIGVIFSAVVAFGLAIVSRDPGASRSAQTFLFGDILTVSGRDLALIAALLLAFLVFQFVSYNRMLCVAVNPLLASVHKIRTGFYQYGFAILLSLTVILAVRTTGVLLVTALLIVPAAAARNFACNAREMFWYTLILSLFSSAAGLILSAQEWMSTPAGATIVLCSFVCFCFSSLWAALFRPSGASDTDK